MRTVLVYNRQSSGHDRVLRDIIEPAKRLSSGEIVEYDIRPTDFTDNVAKLVRILRNNDMVVVAGGDGTASIAANAVLESGVRDVEIAVFGYGNFNDFQSSFRLRKGDLKRVLVGETESIGVRPVEIRLNGEFWRFAVLYFTAGILAESTSVFEMAGVRAKVSRLPKLPRLVYSLAKLAAWFWREIHVGKDDSVDSVGSTSSAGHADSASGEKVRYYEDSEGRKVTDFGVFVGHRMARVLRNRDDYFRGARIGVFGLRLDGLLRAGVFVLGGAIFGVKTKARREVKWEILDGKIWLQTEGEGVEMDGIRSISAKKSNKVIYFVAR